MSVDLAVWEGPRPVGDAEAVATFERLCERFLDGASVPPTDPIADYVQTLLARYPDLPAEDRDLGFEVPWGSGPLLGNASGPIVYIDMKLNGAFGEAWRYCVDLAASCGLVTFDPQAGGLADPDPLPRASRRCPTTRVEVPASAQGCIAGHRCAHTVGASWCRSRLSFVAFDSAAEGGASPGAAFGNVTRVACLSASLCG